jgi:hypothetical protein
MITNESMLDRILRTVLGVGALVLAAALGIGTVGGIIAAVVGGILLVTAAVGFCPLYRVFGVCTIRTGK